MAAAYLERANQVKSLTDVSQFLASYAEVNRVFRYIDGSTAQAAQRVFDLYKRHATEVTGAVDDLVSRNIAAIRERTIAGDCLLRTVYESGSVISVPAVTSADKMPDNIFRKRGGAWEARFLARGRNTILLQGVDKGTEYINLLLAYPEREISVFEIVCGCALGAAESAANTGLSTTTSRRDSRSHRGCRWVTPVSWPTVPPSINIAGDTKSRSPKKPKRRTRVITSVLRRSRRNWLRSRRPSPVRSAKEAS